MTRLSEGWIFTRIQCRHGAEARGSERLEMGPRHTCSNRHYRHSDVYHLGRLAVAVLLIGAGFGLELTDAAFAATLKQEPPMGALREGQVVLVDDGSCPAGRIKRVVGGNHTKVGGTKQIIRSQSCVAR